MLKIGYLTGEAIEMYQSFLLPSVYDMVKGGIPVTVLGLADCSKEQSIAAGAVAAQIRKGELIVHSLYVSPVYRRQGGGRQLLETLYQLAVGKCSRIRMAYTATKAEHEALGSFLQRLGYQEEQGEQTIYSLSLGELEASAYMKRAEKSSQPVPFSQIDDYQLSAVYREAAAEEENYMEMPLTDPLVDRRISMAIIENGQIRSFLAAVCPAPEVVHIAWVRSRLPQDVMQLFPAALAQAKKYYGADTLVTMHAVNPQTTRLVHGLFPAAKKCSFQYVRTITAKK